MPRDVTLRFTANVRSLQAGMLAAAASVKNFEGQVLQVAKTSNETQRIAGAAMVGIGAAIAGGLTLATRSAIQFEERMRNVSTISGDVRDNFGAAGVAVLELSGELGISANQLAEALYDIASAGFQGADGMEVLEVSAKAGQAGLSSASVAARAITGALNAYGLAAASATDVSDILFQTVNLGIVTFDELAQNLGDFVGVAHALGVPLDDVSAAFATITLSGIPAAEAATAVRATMSQLLSPAKALSATLRALGYDSGQQAVASLGLAGTLQVLRNATGGNVQSFAALFPEIRALNGALAVTAEGGGTYARVAHQITDENARAGAAAKALEEQQKSLGFEMRKAKEELAGLAIGLGQALLPVLRPVVDTIGAITAGFRSLGPEAQKGAAGMASLGAAVLTTGGGMLLLAPKIANAVTWFRNLAVTAPALAAGLRSVALSVGVITAVLAIGTIALALYGDAKRKAKERTDEYIDALKAEKQGIEGTIEALVAKKIVDQDLGKIAGDLGLTTETVVRAMLGQKDAIGEINDVAKRNVTHASLQEKGYFKLRDAVGLSNDTLDDATDKLRKQEDAAKALTAVTGKATKGFEYLTEGTKDQVEAAQDAQAAYERFIGTLAQLVNTTSIYTKGLSDLRSTEDDAMEARHDAEKRQLEDEKITGTASQAAHDRRMKELEARQKAEKDAAETTKKANQTATLSMRQYEALVKEATRTRLERMRNLAVIAKRGGADFVDELSELPPEAAGLIAEVAKSSDKEFASFKQTMAEGGEDAVVAIQSQFDLLPSAMSVIGLASGQVLAAKILEGFRTGVTPIDEILRLAGAASMPAGLGGDIHHRGGSYAEGHVAQIAPAGSWRLWAEPETGGEAYIPLAYSKRSRSTALVADVAARFGYGLVPMASGGMWAVPSARVGGGAGLAPVVESLVAAVADLRSDRRRPVQLQQVFHERTDPLHVAAKVSWAIGTR